MKNIIKLLFVSILFYSCDTENLDNDTYDDGFDRAGLLTNWVDNIIIPAYDDFLFSLDELQVKIISFNSSYDANALSELSQAWLKSYKIWQHVEMFDIGLAESINYKGKMNIYPSDSDLINENLLNGNYDLNNNNNFDARGFPAIDYMLHGLASNANDIIDLYINNPKYSIYLLDLIDVMITNTNLIKDDWLVSRSDFINSTENTATSSINKITNDFIFYYEKGLRANKIGIPAGVFSNLSSLPSTVEAYYKSDASKELLLESMNACENFFSGLSYSNNVDGLGFDDYLDFLPASSNNNLSSEILIQFDVANNTIDLLDDNFVDQISTNNFLMLNAYDAVQELVVLFKVDMLQSLSISVDYVDADGD